MNRKTLRLPESFIAFAKSFSMAPVELAARILLDAAQKPTPRLVVKRQERYPAAGPLAGQ